MLERKSKLYIVVRREDGVLHPSITPYKHRSLKAAKAEAQRLAKKHVNQTFVVFSCSATYKETIQFK